MNDKAKRLNMDNTNYSNPDGIDDSNHFTTLNDLLKLTIEISDNIELLSIVSKTKFVYEIWDCKNLKLILNYGTEKIRFISPVICNSFIRANISVQDAKSYKGGILLTSKVIIEIKNSEKPALIAETLSLLYH